jgi:hypothetical protein
MPRNFVIPTTKSLEPNKKFGTGSVSFLGVSLRDLRVLRVLAV